jgi:HlyD family secretion protein
MADSVPAPTRWRCLPALLLVSLALCLPPGLTGCRQPVAAAPAGEAAAAPAVVVGKPSRQTLAVLVEEPGQVEAIEHTPIFARIPGYVEAVYVDMNDRVRKGQVLARLDVPEVENEQRRKAALVGQATAEVELARRTLEAAEANLVTARARVVEAEAGRTRARADYERWQTEFRRVQGLVERRIMDEQTRDETRNQLKASESARDEIEAKVASAVAARDESAALLARARADLDAATARLAVARADERLAQSMLDYREIKAPFDGLVTLRRVHTGHLLKPGLGDNGDALFMVVRTDRVRIFVEVPEAEAVHVHPGSPVRLRTQASRGRDVEAEVTRLSWVIQPANRTLRVEIELPTSDLVRPGMYARAVIRAEHPAVWTLPAAALVFEEDGAYCYRVEGNEVRRMWLRIGARDGGRVEVLEQRVASTAYTAGPNWQPITGAEVVVLEDPAALRDGQVVRTREPAE